MTAGSVRFRAHGPPTPGPLLLRWPCFLPVRLVCGAVLTLGRLPARPSTSPPVLRPHLDLPLSLAFTRQVAGLLCPGTQGRPWAARLRTVRPRAARRLLPTKHQRPRPVSRAGGANPLLCDSHPRPCISPLPVKARPGTVPVTPARTRSASPWGVCSHTRGDFSAPAQDSGFWFLQQRC